MSEEAVPEVYRFCGVTEAMMAAVGAWTKRTITWRVAGDLPGLSREQFRSAVAEALGSWEDVCGLTFKETSQEADVTVTTGMIDRPGNVLAWSELPDGSDRPLVQRYDTADRFVIAVRPNSGYIDVVAVVCHEMGHALGLEHAPSGSPDLMAPIYQPGRRTPQSGDVKRIQNLYGKPAPTSDPDPTPGEPIVIQIWGADRITIPGYTVTKNP